MKKQLFGFGRLIRVVNIMLNKSIIFLLMVFIFSCSVNEERPNYNIIENTIPNSNLVIKWSKSLGFENQNKILSSLGEKDREKFSQSFSWVSTESNIKLATLNGKSAKEFVDLVNCLKSSKLESECVGN